MSGGPLYPFSALPSHATNTFTYYVNDAGGSAQLTETLGFTSSLGADAFWDLKFRMPYVLPSGTCTLYVDLLANATSGSAKINPKWNMAAANTVMGAASLTAEGAQTVTWAVGEAYKRKVLTVTLDANTPTADSVLCMTLTGETSGWTLAANLGCIPFIYWI